MLSLRCVHTEKEAEITSLTGVSPALLSRPRQECARGCESCQVPVLGLSELLTRLPKPSAGEGFGVAPKARGLAGGGSRGRQPPSHQRPCWRRLERWVEAVRRVCPPHSVRSKSAWIPQGPAGNIPGPKCAGGGRRGLGVGGTEGSGGAGFRLRAVHCPRSRGEGWHSQGVVGYSRSRGSPGRPTLEST